MTPIPSRAGNCRTIGMASTASNSVINTTVTDPAATISNRTPIPAIAAVNSQPRSSE